MKLINPVYFIFIVLLIALLTSCSNDPKDEEQEEKQSTNGGEQMKPEEIPGVFLEGDYKRLYNQTSKDFQKEVSLKQLEEIGNEFNQGVNEFTLQSELPIDEGITQFSWVDDGNAKGMVAVVDDSDTIIGFQVLPLQTYPETDERFTKTTFTLPFKDEWFVFWGGLNSLVNYHYEYENQRYAYDFTTMKESRSYEGDPTKNESYYAFGKEMIAPADGKVVQIESEIKDNEPVGKMNENQPAGNYVMIDHGNDEYSLLAHFKHQSIEVKEGDQVRQGDLLGLVGNSGNSSEPHVHFHVADAPDLEDSKSIRINFKNNQEWIQGDFIEGK